jgi:hypothetical protein
LAGLHELCPNQLQERQVNGIDFSKGIKLGRVHVFNKTRKLERGLKKHFPTNWLRDKLYTQLNNLRWCCVAELASKITFRSFFELAEDWSR